MARTKRERTLFLVVVVGLLTLGGSLLGRQLYEAWTNMDEEIDRQRVFLSQLQAIAHRKAGIEEEYRKTRADLTMPQNESVQQSQFSAELGELLKSAGLVYRDFQTQERPRYEEDFKVLIIDVNQAQGTPDQVGTFLYNLENQNNVMDVEEMTITNETVGRSRTRTGELLTMDMRVARLVDYVTGDPKPELNRGRLRMGR